MFLSNISISLISSSDMARQLAPWIFPFVNSVTSELNVKACCQCAAKPLPGLMLIYYEPFSMKFYMQLLVQEIVFENVICKMLTFCDSLNVLTQ